MPLKKQQQQQNLLTNQNSETLRCNRLYAVLPMIIDGLVQLKSMGLNK